MNTPDLKKDAELYKVIFETALAQPYLVRSRSRAVFDMATRVWEELTEKSAALARVRHDDPGYQRIPGREGALAHNRV